MKSGVYWDSSRDKWHVRVTRKDGHIDKRFDQYVDACEFAKQAIDILHEDYKYPIKEKIE